ncbi:MAG TPA: TetR/AcrR family transcriptional regulator [Thermoplasmata archaeon]|nr:TetR/AcrR family transcriptional regulator [Thermoplasmata archaeon]
MSPRRYDLGRRRGPSEATRLRILDGARALLGGKTDPSEFSMEAVGRKAGVSRMTVYNRFHSEAGLLEALADHLAFRGGMQRMPEVFAEPDPGEAVRKFVGIFAGFWASDRLLMRRLRAFGVLHPSLFRALRDRDEWRRTAAENLLRRVRPVGALALDDRSAAALLASLTSFETFEALSAPARPPEEVADLLVGSIGRLWGLDRTGPRPVRRARGSGGRSALPPEGRPGGVERP